MRQSVQLIALLCGSLMLASAQAAPVKMLGFDDMSCAAWNASKGDDEQRAVYLTWMRGVLTGHNYAQPSQQVSSISSGTIEMFGLIWILAGTESQNGVDRCFAQ